MKSRRTIEAYRIDRLGRKSIIWARIADLANEISRIALAKADAYEIEMSMLECDMMGDYESIRIEQENIQRHRKNFKIES